MNTCKVSFGGAFVSIAIVAALAACAALYAAQNGSSSGTAATTGRYGSPGARLAQPQTPSAEEGSVYGAAAYPLFPPALAPGEGRAETESLCSMCHSTRYIVMQPPLPAESWAAEVNKMIKTYGAPISPASAPKIIQYLQQHYTPETRKP